MDFSYLDDWLEEEGEAAETAAVGEGYRNIWAVGEVGEGKLLPATLQVLGQARELADQIGVYVYGVLLGDGIESLGKQMYGYGADKVLIADDPGLAQYQPEVYVQVLGDLVNRFRPEILLLPATPLGNDLAPSLAQELNTGLLSHCIRLELDMSERLLLGTFPVMGGELYHTVACPHARPQIATLELDCFRTPSLDTYRSGDPEQVDVDLSGVKGRLSWIDMNAEVELPQASLSQARIVIGAGRGMGDEAGFALVQQLARALGGVLAGSRGAFDEGWIDEEQIVGVGGKLIAPDLYVACGLSGDIYHYYGLQDAKFVVAINRDESAPIMRTANIAVVGDAREIIPAVIEAISQ